MIRTLLDVAEMQVSSFEARGQDEAAHRAREIRAELRHLKRNPGLSDFGRRIRRLRRQQRQLQGRLPPRIVGSSHNPYRAADGVST